MEILQRIEIKLDALLKCWSIKQGDSQKTLFDIVEELIKQRDEETAVKEKTIEEQYNESRNKGDYFDKLSIILTSFFELGQKPKVDENGYFIFKDRVFNIKDA